jgi:serine/threonine-protein kinase
MYNDARNSKNGRRVGGGVIGRTVSHYRILERLGGGGMGIVYRAQDTRLDRIVALKFLPMEWCRESLFRERFTREARAASTLDHPHICTVFDIDETPEGQLFIAMAYCPGETLKERTLRGPMPIHEAIDIAIQIGEALGAAHEGGTVHRDIKPANILITDRDQVKVVDFGLAKLAGEATVTRQGTVIGTPAYMSPEQATGEETDGRSDLWALGTVLYEMVTGRRAFTADHEQAVLLAITTSDPTPIESLRPEVPAEVQRIIRRCLKRRPQERYQRAGELVADLKRFRGDPTPADIVTQTLPSAARARRRWTFKHRVLPLVAALAAVVLVATLYPAFNQPQTRHLLVLPFNCPGTDTDTDLLCTGLLDTITAKLTEVRRFESSFSVVPVSEVRGQRINSADMAHRIFGVDLVVTGSVLRENASIRIPIELVDATRLRQIRSRTITADNTTGFVLQDRVIAAIEEMLDLEFGAAEREAMMSGGTNNAEAAGLFLEARGHAGKTPTEVHLTRAMSLYREALEIDPEYADALVQLADACDQRYQLKGDSIWLEHGAKYAQRAVALAPELPAAQFAAGRFKYRESLFEGAIEHLQRTIALDPLGLEAYMYLAQAYEAIGEPDLADAAVERAIRTGSENWQTYYDLGKFFYDRHDWEQASGYFREVVRLLPESSAGYSALGSCLFYLGDRDQAREALERGVAIGSGYEGYNNLASLEFYDSRYAEAATLYERALELDDSDHLVWIGLGEARRFAGSAPEDVREAYQQAAVRVSRRLETNPENPGLLIDLASLQVQLGQRTEAIAIIDRLPLDEVTAPDMMYFLAEIFEVLGERDKALAWIERALQTGYPLHVIEDYAAFEALRSDPRFRRLAETYAEPGPDTGVEISEEKEE